MEDKTLASDLLRGAGDIAEYYFGDRRKARSVYHLVQQGNLPGVFWIGNIMHARRSTLLKNIEDQERSSSHQVVA